MIDFVSNLFCALSATVIQSGLRGRYRELMGLASALQGLSADLILARRDPIRRPLVRMHSWYLLLDVHAE